MRTLLMMFAAICIALILVLGAIVTASALMRKLPSTVVPGEASDDTVILADPIPSDDAPTPSPPIRSGPFRTYLAAKRVEGTTCYFKTLNPIHTAGYTWLAIPADSSALISIMDQAFFPGHEVSISLGSPCPSPDDNKAAELLSVELPHPRLLHPPPPPKPTPIK